MPRRLALHAVKPIYLGKRDWLFTGAEICTYAVALVESAKIEDSDPQAHIAGLFSRIQHQKLNRIIDELLPWIWAPLTVPQALAA